MDELKRKVKYRIQRVNNEQLNADESMSICSSDKYLLTTARQLDISAGRDGK